MEIKQRVLVYYGTYVEREILNSKKIFLTNEKNDMASYKKYKDIETCEEYIVPYEECEIFEKVHPVIKGYYSSNDLEEIISSFNEIRDDFLNGIRPVKKEMTRKLINEG